MGKILKFLRIFENVEECYEENNNNPYFHNAALLHVPFFFFFFTQDLKAEHRDFPTRSAVSSQCSVLSISSSLFNCQNPHLICVSREMIRLIWMAGKDCSVFWLLGRLHYRQTAQGVLKKLRRASSTEGSWKRGFCGQICLGDTIYRSTILYPPCLSAKSPEN